MQGYFVQAASPSLQTAHMASTTLEMLKFPQVHANSQPFVRRSALIAASAVGSSSSSHNSNEILQDLTTIYIRSADLHAFLQALCLQAAYLRTIGSESSWELELRCC